MDTLPVESLHRIFINLPFKDRIKCTLVCRQWYSMLNQRSLLYNVYIFKQQYSEFKDMLELLPHRAAQVRQLELAFCFDPDFDKRTLLNMFPNLRYLNLTEISNDFPAKDYISRPFQFMHSTSKLKSVRDLGECELTCQLVISNLGQHLKLLDLAFRNSPTDSYDRVILQLKNMPVLQCLKLSDCPFDLINMKILHINLPSITELQMHSSFIAPSEVPRDIEPATPITSLFFSLEYITGSIQSHIEFYKYLAKKYPSTNDLIRVSSSEKVDNY